MVASKIIKNVETKSNCEHMEVVILSGGKERRMLPLTYSRPESFLPILNKPAIQYTIDAVKSMGAKPILVVSKEAFAIAKKYFKDLTIVVQQSPYGSGDAVKWAKNEIKGKEFIVVNGDIFFDHSILKKILNEPENIIVAKKSEKPWRYRAIVSDKNGYVTGILPKDLTSKPYSYINAGIYKLSTEIFKVIDYLEEKKLEEVRLSECITQHIFEGGRYKMVEINEWVQLNYPDDLIEANKIAFEKSKAKKSMLRGEGKIILEENVKIKNSIVKNSAVGKDSIIENSVVENSYIGGNVRIKGAYISNSLIMENSAIMPNVTINTSIISENVRIGSNTVLADEKVEGGKIKMMVRENEEMIDLGTKFGSVVGANTKIGEGCVILPGVKIGVSCVVYPGSRVAYDVPNFKSWWQ